MKNIICVVGDNLQVEVSRLINRNEARVVSILNFSSNYIQSDDSCLVYNIEEIRRLYLDRCHEEFQIQSAFLTLEQWNEIYKQKTFFYEMSDRCAYFPLPIQDLNEFFRIFVSFWCNLFLSTKADAIVFFSTPHLPFEFVGYLVANVLEKQIRIINRTGIQGISKVTKDIDLYNLREEPHCKVPDNNLDPMAQKNNPDNIFLSYSRSINKKILSTQSSLVESLRLLIIYLARDVYRLMFKSRKYYKPTRRASAFWMSGPENILSYIMEYIRTALASRKKYQTYQKLATEDLPPKYILFTAHFQPERSTMPEGGVFSNMFDVVSKLRSVVPKDLAIVYKEHPRQFDPFSFKKRSFREHNFYQKLKSIDGVYLANSTTSTDDLMKNSVAISTVTGSAGFEALSAGKPVIIFGDAWYRKCRSVLHVSKLSKETLSLLLSRSFGQVLIDLENFLSNLDGAFVLCFNTEFFRKKSDFHLEDADAVTLANYLVENLIE